jgi:hypothetical protein
MTTTGSPFRAPRVTTVATSRTIHAVDTARAATGHVGAIKLVCGTVATRDRWLMLRSSPTADAFVTCKRCAARLADGVTVSADTVRRARLASQLTDPTD